MTKRDFSEFGQLMSLLNETYGDANKPISNLKLDVYFQALEDLNIEQIKQAIKILFQTKTMHIFPVPPEIREAVSGNPDAVAQQALDKLLGAVRYVGGYRDVIFDDPIIHAIIVREGGWIAVCDKTLDEWIWFKKDFMKIYRGYMGKNMADIPKKLTGIHKDLNDSRGEKYDLNPFIIGNKQGALKWAGLDTKQIQAETT